MKNDTFGDIMKGYEAELESSLKPKIPTYIRLDGRSFSKFTKGLPRPFDKRLSNIMIDVTKELVAHFKPDLGYTQSDEISLGWAYRPDEEEFPLFGGRVQKIVSTVSSKATAKFMQLCYEAGGEYRYRAYEMLPSFDARVCQPYSDELPINLELVNMFVWREKDCSRNSVSMAARANFSHSECQNLNTGELLVKLQNAGINYYDYPEFFRRGTFVRREIFEVAVNPDIPLRYQPESGTVMRSRVVTIDGDDIETKYRTLNVENECV